jgi:hypothetical protein
VNAYEAASLTTQWITAIATVIAVFVAALFGWLTWLNTRRSKDAQDRATYAAVDTSGPLPADFAQAVAEVGLVNWEVLHSSGENWFLRNSGNSTAHDVTIEGLTAIDKKRLKAASLGTLGPTMMGEFQMVSRLSISGPGNAVVTFRLDPDGTPSQRTVRVPAP